MSLRARLVLAAALAVAVAVTAAAFFVYARTTNELHREVDQTLRDRAASLVHNRDRPGSRGVRQGGPNGGNDLFVPPPALGGAGGLVQTVDDQGEVRTGPDVTPIPTTDGAVDVARGQAPPFFTDVTVDGTKLRVFTTRWDRHQALQVARPLTETDAVVSDMRIALLVTALVGVLVAAALGFLVARAALRPVRRLTEAVEDVARTHDLSRRIETTTGDDEVGRLAESFNTMLAELDESQRAQRQLAADASHELRTPLTSLRTNIEVLVRNENLDPADRERLLRDVNAQIVEVSAMIGGMMEIARGDAPIDDEIADVHLDHLVAGAVEEASFHWPDVRFVTELRPSVVRGSASRVERAVSNLLDNAGKWSPPGARVEVAVADGEVSVRDHGSGIAPGDVPFVFDRFWRAGSARGTPGSGLGLAIVRQVADQHHATVTVETPADGGTRMRL
ncbi:MAG TPA: HAMP domain-containing sensor histidine kinase, partial [Acidimicrobiia bacterium]|nr:HAMP domain-containing sensor histidine kinase [Acidimicrobiia bacterium]